jgi:hypothetical protein
MPVWRPTYGDAGWQAGVTNGVRGGLAAKRALYGIAGGHAEINAVTGHGADNTGATDSAPAISAAIAAAGEFDDVFLPAGKYRMDSGAVMGAKDRYRIRGAGFGEHSASSVAVGTGTKTFTVPAGCGWTTGCGVRAFKRKDPSVYVDGLVISYSGTTLVIAATTSAGSGTVTDWLIPQVFIDWRGTSGNAFAAGADGWSVYPGTDIGAQAKGATVLNTGDTSSFSGGKDKICEFAFDDNAEMPVVSVAGYRRNRKIRFLCTDIGPTTMTVTPPLPFAFTTEMHATLTFADGVAQAEGVGIEGMWIDATASTSPHPACGLSQAVDSWIYEVGSYKPAYYNFGLGKSVFCEVRRPYGQGRNGSGTSGSALLFSSNSWCLTVDGNLIEQFPCIEINSGSTCNVFVDLHVDRSESFGVIGGSLNANHAPHNSYNLFEGIAGPRFQSDGYFGGASEDTLFRCWFTGQSETSTTDQFAITLNRFTRRYNIVGCQLGTPGGAWGYLNGGPGWDCTSSSSVAIGTGFKTFTVPTGLNYIVGLGMPALIYSASDPTRYMTGACTGYSGTSLEFTVYRTGGSGSASDWVIEGMTGYPWLADQKVVYAFGGPNIGNGSTSADKVVCKPSQGVFWRAWDGCTMVRRYHISGTPTAYESPGSNANYNAGMAYNCQPGVSRDVVDLIADGDASLAGNNSILQWIANNPAKHGLTTWDTPSASSPDWLPISPNSFQDFDRDVIETTLRLGNWNAADGGINASEALGAYTLPDSLIYSSKPGHYGDLAWPAFDPVSPVFDIKAVPAGYFYETGERAPGSALTGGGGGGGEDPPPSGGARRRTIVCARRR